MKSLVMKELKQPLQLDDREEPQPAADEVLVELRAAALNRRDYWITQGLYPGIRVPVILGSDGAGVVTKTGNNVSTHWQGQEILIDPGIDWGNQTKTQSERFQILGMPRDGTFAEFVTLPAACLHPKPPYLDWNEAAALGLGGVTAYRALFTQGELKPAQSILITGIGGGVATTALRFAIACGATVVVTSSNDAKIARAIDAGAAGGFNYTQDAWGKNIISKFGEMDLILDSAGGAGYGQLIDLVTAGGTIVNYGATAGPPQQFDLFKVFWKQLKLIGSTMGSPRDFQAMLEFCRAHQIRPQIDQIYPLNEGNDAMSRMQKGAQAGKLVLAIQ